MRELIERFRRTYEGNLGCVIDWTTASLTEIRAFEHEAKLQIPDDLVQLWTGLGGSDDDYLCAPWYLASFDEVEQGWRLFNEDDTYHSPRWIPVALNFSADYHCLDLDSGQVISVFRDSDDNRLLASNVREYFELIVESFEQGDMDVFEERMEKADGTLLEVTTAFEPKPDTRASVLFAW